MNGADCQVLCGDERQLGGAIHRFDYGFPSKGCPFGVHDFGIAGRDRATALGVSRAFTCDECVHPLLQVLRVYRE